MAYDDLSKKVLHREMYRDKVRTVPCPKCGAEPGENCKGARGSERVSNHIERIRQSNRT